MRRAAIARGAALLLVSGLAACAAGPSHDPAPGAPAGVRLMPGAAAPQGGTVVMLGASPYVGPSQAAAQPAIRPAAAAQPQPRPGTLESSPTGDELAFVTDLLSRMQHQSYATGRETCGYVGRDAAGNMTATAINVGEEASCYLPQVPAGMRLLASVHTHGTYSPMYASEFPTVQDMMTDAQDGIDGYISTPGGRLWHVDTDTMTVRQLCGRGCLPQDPRYRPEDDGPFRAAYTLAELRQWESY